MRRSSTFLLPLVLALIYSLEAPCDEAAGPEPEAQEEPQEPEALTKDDCMACHESDEPVVTLKVFEGSVHGGMGCTDCHMDVEEIPHPKKPGKVDCGMCHDDVAAEYDSSAHGNQWKNGDRDAPWCKKCHGTHDILPASNPESPTSHLSSYKLCAGCHEDQAMTKKHPLPDPVFIGKYNGSVHGRHASEGAAVCADCHTAHSVRKKGDGESSINPKNTPKTCGKCHPFILENFMKGTHGKLWKEGNESGPVCTTCHTAHGITEVHGDAFQMGISSQCGTCHEDRAPSFEDTFHGQATSMGYLRAADCADCHTSHLNLPADDPRSTVNPKNLIKTCGRCHENISAGFVSYNPHPDPEDREKSPLLYFVYKFMVLLLMCVIGFFSIHTLLWLQRVIVALARGEVKRRWSGEAWVTRFSLGQRVTHILVILSFLGLAFTGIPLKYHYTDWARAFTFVLGSIEVARYLHRVCALITFGYAVFHLGTMIHRFYSKSPGGRARTTETIFPGFKDVIDLYHNLRWFLYMGRGPRLGRWSYWEKFDYFAVFWGIPVIGLSGLILWFPEFFTRYLPGDLVNVAMVVHSEEALLALAFIFTFHFFHTHLRPESFPLDPVIFTGKMPLERFKEERPLEYGRLVKEGRLKDILVDPPVKTDITLTRLFGFTAVAVGLIIVLSIFVSFVASILS